MPPLKKYSWREIPGKALKRLKRMVYFEQTMIGYALQIGLSGQEGTDLEFRSYSEHPEVIELLKKAYPKHARLIDQRIREGLRFYAVVTPDGELVASTWFALERFIDPMAHFVINLEKDEVYSHDGKVEPQYRRSRVGANAYALCLDQLYREGRRKVIALVNAENLPAQKWHHYMGFRETGQKINIRFIFGQPRHSWSTYVPKEGVPQVSSKF